MRRRKPSNRTGWLGVAAVGLCLLAAVKPAQASSHREALAILNEPCADTTDIYAWVSPGAHDKLYLIANFLPLHEPGQGNQGLRACDGYRYEFHIAKGKSLKDRVVYRIQFTKTLGADGPPGPNDPLLGGNELLWQLTGGTETYRVTRITSVSSTPGADGRRGGASGRLGVASMSRRTSTVPRRIVW